VVRRREPSRDDVPLLIAAALIATALTAGAIAGAGGFEIYPRVELALDAATLGLAAALPVLAGAPFAWRALQDARESSWNRATEAARA
jgi:hypothetical protein